MDQQLEKLFLANIKRFISDYKKQKNLAHLEIFFVFLSLKTTWNNRSPPYILRLSQRELKRVQEMVVSVLPILKEQRLSQRELKRVQEMVVSVLPILKEQRLSQRELKRVQEMVVSVLPILKGGKVMWTFFWIDVITA
jgi:hypothetical protein